MKNLLLLTIGLLFIGTINSQTYQIKRYPFKTAKITYKYAGDNTGTKTIYIDNYGNKIATISNGKSMVRQPGENSSINFSSNVISEGALVFNVDSEAYFIEVTANPIYLYAEGLKSTEAINKEILKRSGFEKTKEKQKIGEYDCTLYTKKERGYLVKDVVKYWVNEEFIICKEESFSNKDLQLFCLDNQLILVKIEKEVKIPSYIFKMPPSNYDYKYTQTYVNNEEIDKIFGDDLASIENRFNTAGFRVDKYIITDDFSNIVENYGTELKSEGQMTSTEIKDLETSFTLITEEKQTDITFIINHLINISTKGIEKAFGPQDRFEKIEIKDIDIFKDGENTIAYFVRTEEGEEAVTYISLNREEKYNLIIKQDGIVTKEQMLKHLNDSKILALKTK